MSLSCLCLARVARCRAVLPSVSVSHRSHELSQSAAGGFKASCAAGAEWCSGPSRLPCLAVSVVVWCGVCVMMSGNAPSARRQSSSTLFASRSDSARPIIRLGIFFAVLHRRDPRVIRDACCPRGSSQPARRRSRGRSRTAAFTGSLREPTSPFQGEVEHAAPASPIRRDRGAATPRCPGRSS